MSPAGIRREGDGCVLAVCLQPWAGRTAIVGWQEEELKLRVTAPPVDGAANQLPCDFFARWLRVAKGRVRLLAGATSRHKRLVLEGVTPEELRRVLPPCPDNSAKCRRPRFGPELKPLSR